MKRIFILIAAFLTFTAGCRTDVGTVPASADSKISVVSTIFAPYDFVREITGDRADITMLLPPGSESHSYEPTPQDLIKIRNCDIFIYVGGESDAWTEKILDSTVTGGTDIVTLIDCVDAVEEEIADGMQAETGHEAAYDEHVWTSPKNAKLIVSRLCDALCAADPPNASFYSESALSYLERLDKLDGMFSAVTDGAARKNIVFGDRFPFRYLTDAYGLNYSAAFPGCSAESEPSAATVAFLINKVKTENIPVVFYIEQSNERMADTICEATGAKKLLLHSCHNISKTDFEDGISYIDLMERNVENLREALN